MTADEINNPSPAAALVEEQTDIAITDPAPDDAVLEKAMLLLANQTIEAREAGQHKTANVHLDTIDQLGQSWELLDREE